MHRCANNPRAMRSLHRRSANRPIERAVSFVAALTVAAVAIGIAVAAMSYARAHDDYSTWKRPDTGTSCCSELDCYRTEAQFKRGIWYALRREDRRWIAIPGHLILQNEHAKDGKAHLCAPPPAGGDMPFCFVAPEAGT